jgi:hypothetical protein
VSAALEQATPWKRLTSTVCQRAFSSPEAFLYEVGVAPAVAAIAGPEIASALRDGSFDSVLAVSAG